MIKKHWLAIVLLLAIPVVLVLGGALFSFINPEIAAGHANYVLNYRLLNFVKKMVLLGTAASVVGLWVLVCLQVIRTKKRSTGWLALAALGPFGLAILAMLNEATLKDASLNGRANAEADRYSQFVRSMHWIVRAIYEVCAFAIVWELAYQGMVLKRTLLIHFEAARTGMSIAQIIDQQNASGGMWAFAEGLEVMFFVVLLYLLRPVIFNVAARVVAMRTSPKAG